MHRMYADFSDEAYDDMVNGDAKSNNGFRKNDGSFHPDQPDFVEIEDSSDDADSSTSDSIGQIIVLALGLGIVIGTVATPYVKKFWSKTIVPGANKFIGKITGKSKDVKCESAEASDKSTSFAVTEKTGVTAQEFSNKIDIVIEGFKKNMSSEEAQMHMLNIMKLAELLANEIRSLSEGVVKNDEDIPGDYLEWKKAMEKLTTQQVTDGINYMLETNSALFQGETLEGLSWIWGEQQIKEGKLIPVQNEQIKKALEL